MTLVQQKVDKIMDKVPEIKMKRMREHAVDLTFDPDTAHCSLVISQNGKQVATVATKQNVAYNPKRFKMYPEVLAKEGFTTGQFYFEVQVKNKTKCAVGVAKESVDRKGEKYLSILDGYWTIGLDKGVYEVYKGPVVIIPIKTKLQKVGIFVDYGKGVVSFCDVDSHIYSFSGCCFTEKLYPYFCPRNNRSGTNSAPIIITPVPQTE